VGSVSQRRGAEGSAVGRGADVRDGVRLAVLPEGPVPGLCVHGVQALRSLQRRPLRRGTPLQGRRKRRGYPQPLHQPQPCPFLYPTQPTAARLPCVDPSLPPRGSFTTCDYHHQPPPSPLFRVSRHSKSLHHPPISSRKVQYTTFPIYHLKEGNPKKNPHSALGPQCEPTPTGGACVTPRRSMNTSEGFQTRCSSARHPFSHAQKIGIKIEKNLLRAAMAYNLA